MSEKLMRLVTRLVASTMQDSLVLNGESEGLLTPMENQGQFVGYKLSWLLTNNLKRELIIVPDPNLAHFNLIAQVVWEGRAYQIDNYQIEYYRTDEDGLNELINWIRIQTLVLFCNLLEVKTAEDISLWVESSV